MPVSDYRDLRTEYAAMCTWRWHCPGDNGDFRNTRPECQRDPDGACHLYVPEREWARIGAMFRSIPNRPPRCAAAKRMLLALWERGPEGKGVQFWDGTDLIRDKHGHVVGQTIGFAVGRYVAYDSYWFYRDHELPAHEGLHLYYDANPPSWYVGGTSANVRRMESFVHEMDNACAVPQR